MINLFQKNKCVSNMYKVEIMDRDARHRDFNRQVAISDKADELGIRQQLSGYSQMTPEQRRTVSPQVSRLAEELGYRNADGIKRFLLPPYMLFDSRDYQAKYDQKTAAATKQAPLPSNTATACPPCKECPWRDGWTTDCRSCVITPKAVAERNKND